MPLLPPLFGFFLPGCAEQTGSSHSAALFLPPAKHALILKKSLNWQKNMPITNSKSQIQTASKRREIFL